jgi:hypothetical protein
MFMMEALQKHFCDLDEMRIIGDVKLYQGHWQGLMI